MRRCPKCEAVVAEDADRGGVCGEDLFYVQGEPLQDAVANSERVTGTDEKKMVQEEFAYERQVGRTTLIFDGALVGLIIVGTILITLRSNNLNLTGVLLILLALAIFYTGWRRPRYRRMQR